MKRYGEHRFPGKLFVVEGIDGSGKSTQLSLLYQWLKSEGYGVVFSEWNSSPLVRDITKRGKKKHMLTPSTFSLIHATDFADRMEHSIIPLLKAGAVVLCDRYIYTAFARDVARGVHPEWVREVYSFAPRPDLTLYFRVPIDISLERLLSGRAKLKYHEAGMDVGLSAEPAESFRLFQSRVLSIYDQLTAEFGFRTIEAAGDIPNQQKTVRRMAQEILRDYDQQRAKGNHVASTQSR